MIRYTIQRALPLAALLASTAAAPSVTMGADAPKPPAHAEEMSDSVRSVLQDPRYRFCHEDDYPLTPEEHAWCPLVGSHSAACPALPRACKLPPVARVARFGLGRWGARGARDAQGGPPAERAPEADTRQRPPQSFALPDMSGLAQVLFFALLAVFVILVARAIAKNLLRDRDPEETPEGAPPPAAPPGAGGAPPARGPVETDVERLLARARAAASRGDYARAVDDAYAALLRRLDGDGLIAIHPSRTNGDYVRSLRERPELQAPVRAIARDVEQVQFGATAPSEPVFRSVLERVLPLVGRVLGLVLVSFGLSVALSCTPHDGDGGDEGRGDASPSGTQAVIEILGKHGLTIRRRTESFSKLDRPLTLVLLSDAVLDAAAWEHVIAWVTDKGGNLVIAGVPDLPAEIDQRIVSDGDPATEVTVAPHADWAGRPALSWPPGHHVVAAATDGGSALEPLEGTVLVRGDLAVLTERTVGEGRVVVVAEDRLFTNAALAVDDDASFLLPLLFHSTSPPVREVEICDAWTGAGAQTPFESVEQARLTPVIVQLFVLLGLLILWKGRAFARLRDPPSLTGTRRAFVDHARALGLAYGRSRASRHVTGLYAVWALERLRERVHRSGRQGLIPLAEAIALRTGRPEGEVMGVLVEATGARDEAAPPSSFRDSSRRPAAPASRGKAAVESDLALMRALVSFLSATGKSRPTDPKNPPVR